MSRTLALRSAPLDPTAVVPCPRTFKRDARADVPAPAQKEPSRGPWSSDETRALEKALADGFSPRQCLEALAGQGFRRTTKAIKRVAASLGLAFAKREGRGRESKITGVDEIAFLKSRLALGLSLDELVQGFAERGLIVSRSLVANRIHELDLARPQPEPQQAAKKETSPKGTSPKGTSFCDPFEEDEQDEGGLLFVSHETAKRACKAHLEDLYNFVGEPLVEVPDRETGTPRAIFPLNHSPFGSAAAACAEG